MTSPSHATLQQPGRFDDLSKMLEPYDGKLSRTVLRGEGGRKAPDLPGDHKEETWTVQIASGLNGNS